MLYCGVTISESPKQIFGELYTSENAETYIEYMQNNTLVREEVLPGTVQRIHQPSQNKPQNV